MQGLNLEEWFAADYWEFTACVEEYGADEDAYRNKCDFYDTYDNAFEQCGWDGDCNANDTFFMDYPTGRVEEVATIDLDGETAPIDQLEVIGHDLENEIGQLADKVGDAVAHPMGPATYSFYFDQDAVNAWLDKEAQMYGQLHSMYEAEMQAYMDKVAAVTEEHAPKFAEIDELMKLQVDDTLFDLNHWFEDNFSMEYADECSALSLAAKVENRQSKGASNTDILMYAGTAIASLGVFAWTFKQINDKRKN